MKNARIRLAFKLFATMAILLLDGCCSMDKQINTNSANCVAKRKFRLNYLRHGCDSGQVIYLSERESHDASKIVEHLRNTERRKKSTAAFIPSPPPDMYILEVYESGRWKELCNVFADGTVGQSNNKDRASIVFFREILERFVK